MEQTIGMSLCVRGFVKVSTDESEYNEYTRYGADDWYVTMREEDVQMFDSHELEFLYQNYITKK